MPFCLLVNYAILSVGELCHSVCWRTMPFCHSDHPVTAFFFSAEIAFQMVEIAFQMVEIVFQMVEIVFQTAELS